jgi:alkylhydroperoxidase family enzyme
MGAATLATTLAGCATTPPPGPGFTPRLKAPRIAPIPLAGRTEAQVAMLASRPDYNIYKTLAVHPELYARWSGLGQFVLNGSSLPPRHREMIILRMGWLCQAEYEWAQHARIGTGAAVGLSAADIHAIAEGSRAAAWTLFERALLQAVDEIRYEAMISDATWAALRAQYSVETVMDALFTAGQYQLVSMALNSLGVQLDPDLTFRLPTDVPAPPLARIPRSEPPATPRIAPKPIAELTAADKTLLAERLRPDGTVFNLYATLIVHPKLYGPRARFGSYIQRDSGLPPRARELAILRTAHNIACEYEWVHHRDLARQAGLSDAEIDRVARGPSADGWSQADRAVLAAADELRRECFVSDATWSTLTMNFAPQRLVELVFTVGGYCMTGAAIRSFGIQLEPQFRKRPA